MLENYFQYGTQEDEADYSELPGSGARQGGEDEASLTRIYKLYDYQFANEFLNATTGFAQWNDDGTKLIRELPDRDIECKNYWANKYNLIGLYPGGVEDDNDNTNFPYPSAQITVNYEPMNFNVLEDDEVDTEFDRFVEFSSEPQIDYISQTINPIMYFVNDLPAKTHSLKSPPGIPICTPKLCLKWHDVPGVEDSWLFPMTNILDVAGTLNDGVWHGYADQSLLFQGCVIQPTKQKILTSINDADVPYFNVSYHFGSKEQSWNYFYNIYYVPGSFPRIQLLTKDGTSGGSTMFQVSDFDNLFRIS